MTFHSVGICYQRIVRRNASSAYWALKDVSFSLIEGESLGVIGRNGAGKSTLLRLMAGIISPDRGEITRGNVTASLLGLQVGFIPRLSGRENAYLSGMLLGVSRREMQKKMDSIIDFSELADFIDEPVGNYSAGMRARLGFSVAIQVEPDILLIDEVLGVGDREFRSKSSRVLKDRLRSNKTVVLVSHNPETIRDNCDRVVWIEEGKTHRVGFKGDVLAEYLK